MTPMSEGFLQPDGFLPTSGQESLVAGLAGLVVAR